ncbi:LOW QUALITY PROTEIN: disrupted in schizophrenia 1 protein-like [Rhynchonycteris naso]
MFAVLFSLFPGRQECLPPAEPFWRRRLAWKRYMRGKTGPQIRFLSPAADTSLQAQGGLCPEDPHHSESRAAWCGLDPGGQGQGHLVGSPLLRSTAASALTCVGHLDIVLTLVKGTSGFFGTQFRAGTKLLNRLTRFCGPGVTGCAPGPHRDAACGEGARGTWTRACLAPEKVSSPEACSAPASSQGTFTSNFNFIQLSLSSAGERGKAEGCPLSLEDTEAKAAGLDRPCEDPRLFFVPFSVKAVQGPADSAQTAAHSLGLELEPLPVLDTDAASSCTPDPTGFKGAALHWDPLLSKCEPLLLECQLSNHRLLEVNTLQLKLQKLQEKAVEDDNYDKVEALKLRLEDLEKEKSSLHFQLPLQQPALNSLLVYLGAQAEAALCWAAQQEDTQAPLRGEPAVQDNLCVSITRWDWLLQEKQQLQKEIEALQARMSVLEAKDQQLRREIDVQEPLWQGCDLSLLMGRLSLGELPEVALGELPKVCKAVQDTLALASQIPLPAGPPKTIRSLQESIKSLNLSLKEITEKVEPQEELKCGRALECGFIEYHGICNMNKSKSQKRVGPRDCSTLRKNVNEIETQLLALLEAKMLAISGSHFCTAEELTEQSRSLTSERGGLEELLNRLAVLSSRNVQKLGSVEADYRWLRWELDHGKTHMSKSLWKSQADMGGQCQNAKSRASWTRLWQDLEDEGGPVENRCVLGGNGRPSLLLC